MQCSCYIGDKGESYKERTFNFCRPAPIYDHFDREHTVEIRNAKYILYSYPKYKSEVLGFEYLNYFKNYIKTKEGLRS